MAAPLIGPLDRRFEALIFDWDGTAVADRRADASRLRQFVEELCSAGMDLAVVSGTHVGNIDGQFRARPAGPGHLYLCLNRGSEVYSATQAGVQLLYRRMASTDEEACLDEAARVTLQRLGAKGLEAAVVSRRLNRRKIDLIPLPEWADPPKARIAELLTAVESRLEAHGLGSLMEVVELAAAAARESGLADARITTDAKHVEIGLTDKSDSARWVLSDLWRRGIGPGLVLVVGDEFGPLGGVPGSDSSLLPLGAERATGVSVGIEPGGPPESLIWKPGGPAAFVELLEDQLRRRRAREVPRIDLDPRWVVEVQGIDPQRERAHDAELALSDGCVGTSGVPLSHTTAASPRVLVSGAYVDHGPDSELLHAPVWNRLDAALPEAASLTRTLDLRTGVLHQELGDGEQRLRTLEFSSLHQPGTVAMRAEGPATSMPKGHALEEPGHGVPIERGQDGACEWMLAGAQPAAVLAVARDSVLAGDGCSRLERLAMYTRSGADRETQVQRLDAMSAGGYDELLADHRAAWAGRWEEAAVDIEGDLQLERATRFALFHLISSVTDHDEAAVGARGLSGSAYRGHVFWDSDVFVLPFLAATHPAAARAMLEYRIRRLPAARAAARRAGMAGARFPWESAAGGEDVTPTHAVDQTGRTIPIRTGFLEEHVVADVAWSAGCYVDWTGDREFESGPGAELLVETARYWASRIRLGPDGRGHINGVIGPDEYHEAVDDNAYTNVMARWNLRRAAAVSDLADGGVAESERRRWLEVANSIADGYDATTRLYEQFAGFFGLEPLIIRDAAPRRPIAADLLLGRERVHGAQVVKQADVLMLHHLVPDEVAPGSLVPNLDFYEPRTAHGSSLSPGVHAALFARAGRLDEAVDWLRLTTRIDLDDLTGSTAGGIHLAAMGSVWQALAFGFAGIRASADALSIDPHLPQDWSRLTLRLRFHGALLEIAIADASLRIAASAAVPVRIAGGAVRVLPPGPSVLSV